MQEATWAMQWHHRKPEETQGHGPAAPWKPCTQPNVLAGKSDLKAVTKCCSLAVPTQQETEEREGHLVTKSTSFQAVAVGAVVSRALKSSSWQSAAFILVSSTEDGSLTSYRTQIPRTYVKYQACGNTSTREAEPGKKAL